MNTPTPSENIFLAQTGDAPVFYASPALETKSSGTCDLLILVEKPTIQLALKERRSGMLLALEIIPAEARKQDDWKQILESTSARSRILRGFEFSKVTAGITTNEFTLVPEALFKPGDEHIYFRKNFTTSPEVVIYSRHVPSYHLYTIFGLNHDLESELNHLFQDPQLVHHSQALLSGLSMLTKSVGEKKLWLNVRRNKTDIVVWENKKLILLNSFLTNTNEDILYYALFVCEQLEMNPEKLMMTVTGEIETDSVLYQLLYKYIRNIDLPEKPNNLQNGFAGKISFHQYATLYNLALCE